MAAVDWKGLEEAFKQGRPRTAAQRLRSLLSARITALVRLNPVARRPGRAIREAGCGLQRREHEHREFFQELLEFGRTLTEEEARSLSEGLTEEQLAIFDLLMRPAPELSEDEKSQVKRVAEELLAVLKRGKIVLDWRKGTGDAGGGARCGGGDPGPAAGEVHTPDLRPEMRRGVPARLRLATGTTGTRCTTGPHEPWRTGTGQVTLSIRPPGAAWSPETGTVTGNGR